MKKNMIILMLVYITSVMSVNAEFIYYCKLDAGFVPCHITRGRTSNGAHIAEATLYQLTYFHFDFPSSRSLKEKQPRVINIPSEVEVYCAGGFGGESSQGKFTVTGIGKLTFGDCTNVVEINLPSTIKYIGSQAFLNCSKLKSINLPAGINYVNPSAFEGCTSLEQINVGKEGQKNNAGCTVIDGMLCYKDTIYCVPWARFNASNGEFTVPSQIVGIHAKTFAGNQTIRKVSMTRGCIGDEAFKGCNNLTEVVLGNEVTDIGESAFEECLALEKAIIPASVKTLKKRTFYWCMSLKSVSLGEGLQKIGPSAFESCTSLQAITIPRSITDIDKEAFKGCTTMRSVTFPSSTAGLKQINQGFFSFCESLKEIKFPTGIKSVEKNAFLGCTALERVTLNTDIENIFGYSFMGCSNLTTINIPTKTYVNSNAFDDCPKLKLKR